MRIPSGRFGELEISGDQIFVFPEGIIGFPQLRHVVLLVDESQPNVIWLQALTDPHLAFAAISPRQVVPDYRLRISRSQLAPLGTLSGKPLHVLALLNAHQGHLWVNLRAPILIDQPHAMGCQVVALDEWPIRYALAPLTPMALRRSA